MRCPVDFISIAQSYGSSHKGIDFGWYSLLHRGMPIYACDDGVVIYNRYQSTGGYVIHIRHDNGYVSGYGHLKKDSQRVHEGDRVKKGQQIANMGDSGQVTGMHLHFELYKGTAINYSKKENFVDPLKYINQYDNQVANNKSKGKIKHTKKVVYLTDPPLNIRNAPNTSGKIIDKKYTGDEVETYGLKGTWNIVDNIREYYCSNKYLN